MNSINPALAFVPKFFVISGAILVVSGLAQMLVRVRRPDETTRERFLNGAVIRASVFVPVGILGILLGLGILPMPHFR